MYKMFHLIEQNMSVQVTEIQCTYVLYKQHGQLFRTHSRIFFLSSVGETNFFNSVGKMAYMFAPRLDIVSERYMAVLILLPYNSALFLRL